MRVVRGAFVVGSVAWALALPLATLAATLPRPSPFVYTLTFAVYAIGRAICHQLPERSFHLWGAQMPVCARCAGIYLGAAMAVLIPAVARRLQPSVARSPRGFALLALAPTLATLLYEWTTGVTPANGIRALAGLALGAGVATLVEREVN